MEENVMSSAQPRELARNAFWKTAGQLVQLLRERQGWSYQELADRAEVTADLVVAYELARLRFPELEACWRISTALGVDLPTFLHEVEKRAGVTLITGVRPLGRGAQPLSKAIETPLTEQDALSDFVRKAGGQ
jgi:transcriptional regulator with XRE-family HTH domain